MEDVNEAISLHREALALRPAPHPDRSSSLNNLASVLGTRFDQTALALRPAPHPDRSSSLNNLANVLDTRFSQIGDIEDVNEAIFLLQEALSLRPAPHPSRSGSLENLAAAFGSRFSETGDMKDVNNAISLLREALTLRPASHSNRSDSLYNLAKMLGIRFGQTCDMEDGNEAISLHREALELRPTPHPDRSNSLDNLASVLSKRYSLTDNIEDWNEARTLWRKAIQLLTTEHPDICAYYFNLGQALSEIYSRTQEPAYHDDSITSLRSAVACQAASALERFRAARFWARHADDASDDSAFEAYHCAIQLLPRLAMLGLDLQSRRQVLVSRSDGLARNAVACAIRFSKFDKALEFLEEGRATFWSQALQLRTPLDALRLVAPEIEQRLKYISRALEQGAFRDISTSLLDTQQQMSLDQARAHYHRLNKDWLATLEDVRKLEGFYDFLRPKSLQRLQLSATNGPVVILNAGDFRCDALILTSSGIRHVALPNITSTVAKNLVRLIQIASSSRSTAPLPKAFHKILAQHMRNCPDVPYLQPVSERHGNRIQDTPVKSNDIFRLVLAELWKLVVHPVVCSLNLKKSKLPPRLWWCPTGPFALLPIHAAGTYYVEQSDCLHDFVISSYTPTLDTLLAPPPLVSKPFKMAAIIQSSAPGYPPLPYTLDELEKIKQHVPSESLVTFGVPGTPATVQDVSSHLPDFSIVHFACHGQQNIARPLDSALILEDGHLKLSQIMQASLPRASLAFLSACQTARGDGDLPDEAIHLAASLLFAGFRGVVATMWAIVDSDGPTVADKFYGHLFKSTNGTVANTGVCPDSTEAALALHLAVTQLRSETPDFSRWVPFVHFGL